MDELGDLLYFFLIIGVAIAGAIKKSKKKTAQTAPKQVTPTSGVDIENPWQQFEEVFGHNPIEIIDTNPAKAEPKKSEILSYETANDYSKLRVKKRISESVSKSISVFNSPSMADNDSLSDYGNFDIKLEDPDEARIAFVYSEIFNRKFDV